jgi:hypothetical protein
MEDVGRICDGDCRSSSSASRGSRVGFSARRSFSGFIVSFEHLLLSPREGLCGNLPIQYPLDGPVRSGLRVLLTCRSGRGHVPVVLLALDNYPLQRLARLSSGSLPEARRDYLEKAPYLLLAIAFYVTALAARNHPSAARAAGENDLFNWMLDLLAAPGFFLWKAILPIGLTPAYEPSTYFFGSRYFDWSCDICCAHCLA